jgi:hypothetical protein
MMLGTRPPRFSYFLGSLFLVAMASCATNQGRYMKLAENVAARDADCMVDVFKVGLPIKNYIKVSRLDVHLEKTHFRRPTFDDAIDELRKQACLSGADAIIDVEERSSSILETGVYHITATGVKYTN